MAWDKHPMAWEERPNSACATERSSKEKHHEKSNINKRKLKNQESKIEIKTIKKTKIHHHKYYWTEEIRF